MARTKRKAGGPTRGRFKPKKMGKGYNAHRTIAGRPKPIDRAAQAEREKQEQEQEKLEKQGGKTAKPAAPKA